MITVAVLGGTSHIAKGLISRFLQEKDFQVDWFGRSAAALDDFLRKNALTGNIAIHNGYEKFPAGRYDVLINCVGAGTPEKLKNDFTLWFTVLEQYDNLCLDYLRTVNRSALYVDFSSGAVYGRNPEKAVYETDPNKIETADFYALAKLYSEAKHRSFKELNIADIRIFSYFSRFADENSSYFMTDVLSAVRNGTVLNVSEREMIRDYISPDDLYSLVLCCIQKKNINTAMDAYSKKSVSKKEILEALSEKFHLQYAKDTAGKQTVSPNSTADIYVPRSRKASETGYVPCYSSIEGLLIELEKALLPDFSRTGRE